MYGEGRTNLMRKVEQYAYPGGRHGCKCVLLAHGRIIFSDGNFGSQPALLVATICCPKVNFNPMPYPARRRSQQRWEIYSANAVARGDVARPVFSCFVGCCFAHVNRDSFWVLHDWFQFFAMCACTVFCTFG